MGYTDGHCSLYDETITQHENCDTEWDVFNADYENKGEEYISSGYEEIQLPPSRDVINNENVYNEIIQEFMGRLDNEITMEDDNKMRDSNVVYTVKTNSNQMYNIISEVIKYAENHNFKNTQFQLFSDDDHYNENDATMHFNFERDLTIWFNYFDNEYEVLIEANKMLEESLQLYKIVLEYTNEEKH
jgi:hypothetical protein